jgi:hypothetical protein
MNRNKHQRVPANQRVHLKALIGAVSIAMIAATFGLLSAPTAMAAAPPAPFFNGFENATDVATYPGPSTQAMFDVNRVTSGTNGIPAASGGYFAEAAQNPNNGPLFQATRQGGYSFTFPVGGYTTSAQIYLDMSQNSVLGTDRRFDWSSAINSTTDFERDFIWNVGTDPLNTGQFAISASNNAPGWPSNPGRNPAFVNTTGWYTFQSKFYDNGSGVLAVDMNAYAPGVDPSTGTPVYTETLSNPSDLISTTGGNRYQWLVDNDFTNLAIDNINRSGTGTFGACQVSVTGSNPTVYTLLADCTTDHTIVVPQNAGGSVFNGNGHSITGVDPTGGHFLGAVVQAQAGSALITVKNLTVTVSNLVDLCDGGNDRLRGILFDAVGGTITNNTVTDIEQGANGESGCQEGNAIEARNAPFTGGGVNKNVTISGNEVTDYQKTGIVANGSVAATIKNNTVTGDGPISYIAQNGIQVGYGAKATVSGNTVSGNAYTGTERDSSAGILVVGGDCFGLAYTVGLSITKNTLTNNDVGVWLYNATGTYPNCVATTIKTNNTVKLNTISNGAVTNTNGDAATVGCGYQVGVADLGHKDLIVNNQISGVGYTKTASGDCTGPTPAFLRFIDTDSSARGVPSNK